jgi:hypothetical protein
VHFRVSHEGITGAGSVQGFEDDHVERAAAAVDGDAALGVTCVGEDANEVRRIAATWRSSLLRPSLRWNSLYARIEWPRVSGEIQSSSVSSIWCGESTSKSSRRSAKT